MSLVGIVTMATSRPQVTTGMLLKDWKDIPESILTKIVRLAVRDIQNREDDELDDLRTHTSENEQDVESNGAETNESKFDFVIKCAQVCRQWSIVIIRKELFDNFSPPYINDVPDPWELGLRWHIVTQDKYVNLSCKNASLMESIGKILLGMDYNHTKFALKIPVCYGKLKEDYRVTLPLLKKHLEPFCTHLSFDQEDVVDYGEELYLYKPVCFDLDWLIVGNKENKKNWPLVESV